MQSKRSRRPRSQKRKERQSVTFTFLLASHQRFSVQIPYNSMTNIIRTVLKKYEVQWNTDTKLWEGRLQNYKNCLNQMKAVFLENNSEGNNHERPLIKIQKIPEFVNQALLQMPLELQVKNNYLTTLKTIKYSELETNIDPRELPFYKKLYGFQKQSLEFGIKKHGRILLADQMGVGKTLQSLAIASIYKHQWPLLIICPSSLRLNWQQEILNWLPEYVKPHQIQVYSNGGKPIKDNITVLIVSYDLAWKMIDMLQKFKIAIVDQAHYLKNSGNKRSDNLMPFLSTRKRVLLLTGTPALARPREIYNLISIIRPDVFINFKQFGVRYCEPKLNPWSRSIQYNGCQNSKELYYILKDRIMIRRLKREVLTELPDKQRQKVVVETDKNIVKEINNLLNNTCNLDDGKMQNFVADMLGKFHSNENAGDQNARQAISIAYSLTGKAKLQAAKQYILQLLQNQIKILVFAHHIAVLDGLQEAIKHKNYKYIRIDGSVSKEKRHQNVTNFQEKPQIMVALLSISAAGVGLTLTASSTVVFVELHWTPGMMIQAQDRAHRIGQKSSVNCHYLIGEKTLDSMLYSYLQRKITNVSSFVDGKQQNLQIQYLQKGQKGKVSISKDSNSLPKVSKNVNILFKFQSVKSVIDKYCSFKQVQSEISEQIHDSITEKEEDIETYANSTNKKRQAYEIKQEISGEKYISTSKKQQERKDEEQHSQYLEERSSSDMCQFLVQNQSQILQFTQSMRQMTEQDDQTQ